jgi:2-succinyl-5-enolpyruvyl-6-hydroxy-3-cyclohexene-1-carboxylate synthase
VSVVQATFAATLVDEWVRAGVTDAVVCPGSRSAPLAMALAARTDLSLHVRLDERGAGFFAVGLALVTGRPAVVCVTSGTAAAELHPAVVEAHHARVPVIVCTADRPPELHGVGAPQTIEQSGLYGAAVRWSADPGVPVEETTPTWRSLGARAFVEATAGPCGPGPVHLNLAFREPLVDEPGPLPPGRPGGRPFHVAVAAPARAAAAPGRWPGRRGVLVAGAGCGPPESVLALAERLGWPVLADPRSGCRRAHPNVVAAADALARLRPDALRPDAVVRLGAAWASRELVSFLSDAETVVVDPWWRWEDPGRTAAAVHLSDPGAWIEAALQAPPPGTPAGWLGAWQEAERAAQAAIDGALCAEERLSEPAVARTLYASLPSDTVVMVSSSMPVRDLEWFAPTVPRPPRVLSNRGANGIDGVCSTALGAAAATASAVVALVGDLAFLHDVSALVTSSDTGERRGSCTLVVVDNAGGGIFEFLPQATATARARFERLFGTPQSPDIARVAAGFGLECADVGTPEELGEALARLAGSAGLSVVRARVPARPANVAVHQRIHAAVAAGLSGAGGVAGDR